MKNTHILIALAMLAALTMVSCKNNKKSVASQEPTQEEVQEMKQALADSVLAEIDAIADNFFVASENVFHIGSFELTEAEKLIKPDYLLDPSEAANLVTKSQKVNALAIYLLEYVIRYIYDMPQEETKEVIAKLALDVNHPIDNELLTSDIPSSEKMKKEYEICKERGDLAYFWQFQNAFLIEVGYIIAQNPESFFSKITEEQWQAFANRTNEKNYAMRELAKYDEEMADVLEMFNQNRVFSSDEEKASADTTIESAKEFLIASKERLSAHRNALLQ